MTTTTDIKTAELLALQNKAVDLFDRIVARKLQQNVETAFAKGKEFQCHARYYGQSVIPLGGSTRQSVGLGIRRADGWPSDRPVPA
jgi:hypothetical protein